MSHPRFSIIPAGAVTDRSLEPRDLQVLCLLGRHTDKAGWCARSQVKMAQELDCSRGSVQNSLDRLSTAGWIEKKRRDTEVEEAGKQPSRSYAYRVLLDRDDFAFENASRGNDEDDSESYAENASDEAGCQPVGTPPMPTDQHPGANPCVGTGANPYVGTRNDPLERPHLERERDARARERNARFIVAFEARWPTAAADDRQRTAYAAEALSEDEQEAALACIAAFLEDLQRHKRKGVPAGWKYLEQKRWTLLTQTKAENPSSLSGYAAESDEGKAIIVAHDIVASDAVRRFMLRNGKIYHRVAMTPRLVALAHAPPREEWVGLSQQQAAAWEALLREIVTVQVRKRLKEGDIAPWPWPPAKDGRIYDHDEPPQDYDQQQGDHAA